MKKKAIPLRDEFTDFFAVERIPGQKASAVFITKNRQTFREDVDDLRHILPDGTEYIPWGTDDQIPYDLIDLIEGDETLATCQIFNAEVCYGSGLKYCTEDADASVRSDVEQFLLDNPMPDYFLGVCQDLKHFNFAISVIDLNADGDKIVGLQRKEACYCRFSPADSFGRISYVLYGPFRNPKPDDVFEKIPLLDPHSPWKDLEMRIGQRTRPDGTIADSKERKFAIITKFPGVDSLYYPIPHYASLFRGAWYDIKRLIGVAKLSKLKNSAPIKYVVEVSQRYWDNIFQEQRTLDPKERQKIVNQRKREMMRFLTTTENTGSILFTGKSLSVDGKNENADITVTSIDSKTKEGGDWESDIAEAINMICFTMRVHSNLVGSVPGKAQTNNSGSDKRELYTIAQALQKPYHDILFQVHDIIIRFNGWKGVHPECPFIQLTTLDEHQDAKEVTLNKNKDNGKTDNV
ncbi:hypothetical protein [uncultured Duncaniella sp.]|uniref:hypothetical protein n=1 Tax=uncultured Duncaniella sp. TaxID=2768039 RepID=UPI0026752A19|nr:hypothetical protein [uncultured Duncaniella sp.]